MRRSNSLLLALATGFGAALVASELGRYRRDIAQARERVATGGLVARTACGPIEYAVTGEGPPLLVVHGAGGGFDQGLDLGAPFAAEGLRVIAMSRFGYLGTPLPSDASAAAQADAHASLLDTLGIGRAAVIGFSAGAPSCIELALRHPERVTALALVVPAAFVPRADKGPSLRTPAAAHPVMTAALGSDLVFWAAIEYARSTVIEAILGTPATIVRRAPPEERARVDRILRHILPVTARRLGLLNDGRVVSSLERVALERIDVPTLVASAIDDGYGTLDAARHAAAHIPGARLVEFPDGGHLLVGREQALQREVMALLHRGES